MTSVGATNKSISKEYKMNTPKPTEQHPIHRHENFDSDVYEECRLLKI